MPTAAEAVDAKSKIISNFIREVPMEIIQLKKENLEDWAEAIPEELFIDLMLEKKGHYAAGVLFLEQPAGALCWEENEAGWTIESIYIYSDFRRLGLATDLLDYLSKRMLEKKAKVVSITYTYDDEVAMLNDFFIHYGFDMEEVPMPTGEVSLQQVAENIKKQGLVKKPANYAVIGDLTYSQRGLVDKWLMKHLSVHIDAFEAGPPYSYVIMDKEKIQAMLLFSQKDDEISVDFCMFKKDSLVKTLPLLVVAIEDLTAHFSLDTTISMLLANDASTNFYNKLTGGQIKEAIVYTGKYLPIMSTLY